MTDIACLKRGFLAALICISCVQGAPAWAAQFGELPAGWAALKPPEAGRDCVDLSGTYLPDGERIVQKGNEVTRDTPNLHSVIWAHPRGADALRPAVDLEADAVWQRGQGTVRQLSASAFGILVNPVSNGQSRWFVFDKDLGDYECKGSIIEYGPKKSVAYGEGFGGRKESTRTRLAKGVDGSLYVFQELKIASTFLVFTTSPSVSVWSSRFVKRPG